MRGASSRPTSGCMDSRVTMQHWSSPRSASRPPSGPGRMKLPRRTPACRTRPPIAVPASTGRRLDSTAPGATFRCTAGGAAAGACITGPALLERARRDGVDRRGLGRQRSRQRRPVAAAHAPPRRSRHAAAAAAPDPLRLEVFSGLFMHVAEQMGVVLRQTASSVNIKERLDYSCALFDGDAHLVANAPHMPVHLGSMGASVRRCSTRTARPAARRRVPAQLAVPRRHAPARHDRGHAGVRSGRRARALLHGLARAPCGRRRHHAGLDAARQPRHRRGRRADHADPHRARRALRRGRWCAGCWRRAPGPPATSAQNLADLRAQLAANARGIRELERGRGWPRLAGAARLHGARAGQRRSVHAPRDPRGCATAASATRWTTARRSS